MIAAESFTLSSAGDSFINSGQCIVKSIRAEMNACFFPLLPGLYVAVVKLLVSIREANVWHFLFFPSFFFFFHSTWSTPAAVEWCEFTFSGRKADSPLHLQTLAFRSLMEIHPSVIGWCNKWISIFHNQFVGQTAFFTFCHSCAPPFVYFL